MSRLIGLDHGSRRIGVAVGDTETGMAFARAGHPSTQPGHRSAAIEALAEVESAELVVIGLPLNMDGTEGGQAASARTFGERLVARGLRIAYEDERLSSWEAGERLVEAGRRPRRESGELDSTAARLILQQYLDARRRTGPPEETE